MGPHGRLAAGEADRLDAEPLDEHPGDPLDLLEGEDLGPGQPRHALLGHAVGAAEVAAVGDRDAQVAVHTPEGVDQGSRHLGRDRIGHGPARLRRRGHDVGQEEHPDRRRPRRRRRRRGAAARPWARRHGGEVVGPLAAGRAQAQHAAASRSASTRTKWTLPSGCRRKGSAATAGTSGRSRSACPARRRRAGPGEELEADHRRHGVAGQAEHRRGSLADDPERERLGRADRDLHPPHVADAVEHDLHEVDVAHRHAPAREHGVAGRGAVRDGGGDGRLVVADQAEVDGQPAVWATSASSVARFESRICPGPSGRPASTSSSPVDSTPTRGRGWASTSVTPMPGQHAEVAPVRSPRRERTTASPARRSSPGHPDRLARRHLRADGHTAAVVQPRSCARP